MNSLYLDCRQFLIVFKSSSLHILKAVEGAHRHYFFAFSDQANGKEVRAVIVVQPVSVQSVGEEKKSPVQLIFNEKVIGQFPNLELAILQITYFISQVCIYGLSGVVKIHGAALAKSGKALIVSANKYAGKSSLSVDLGLTGTQVLTDELVILNPGNHIK